MLQAEDGVPDPSSALRDVFLLFHRILLDNGNNDGRIPPPPAARPLATPHELQAALGSAAGQQAMVVVVAEARRREATRAPWARPGPGTGPPPLPAMVAAALRVCVWLELIPLKQLQAIKGQQARGWQQAQAQAAAAAARAAHADPAHVQRLLAARSQAQVRHQAAAALVASPPAAAAAASAAAAPAPAPAPAPAVGVSVVVDMHVVEELLAHLLRKARPHVELARLRASLQAGRIDPAARDVLGFVLVGHPFHRPFLGRLDAALAAREWQQQQAQQHQQHQQAYARQAQAMAAAAAAGGPPPPPPQQQPQQQPPQQRPSSSSPRMHHAFTWGPQGLAVGAGPGGGSVTVQPQPPPPPLCPHAGAGQKRPAAPSCPQSPPLKRVHLPPLPPPATAEEQAERAGIAWAAIRRIDAGEAWLLRELGDLLQQHVGIITLDPRRQRWRKEEVGCGSRAREKGVFVCR